MNRSNFGEKLKTLRKNAGLTQVEVANQIGYPQGKLSTLEQRAHLPSDEILDVLCDYFQVSRSYFVELGNSEKLAQAREYVEYLRFADMAALAPRDSETPLQTLVYDHNPDDEYLAT